MSTLTRSWRRRPSVKQPISSSLLPAQGQPPTHRRLVPTAHPSDPLRHGEAVTEQGHQQDGTSTSSPRSPELEPKWRSRSLSLVSMAGSFGRSSVTLSVFSSILQVRKDPVASYYSCLHSEPYRDQGPV